MMNRAIVKHCFTLELPWKDNMRYVSCIPPGNYYLHKDGNVLRIMDVLGRDGIQIHSGNYHKEIHGCILVGKELADMDNDGYRDVTISNDTMDDMFKNLDPSIQYLIKIR